MNSVRLHGCKWNVNSWCWLAAFVMLWVLPASALEYSQAPMLAKLVDDGKFREDLSWADWVYPRYPASRWEGRTASTC